MPKVTQKGQVTIPTKVRKQLNVKQGDEVVFKIEDEQVIIKKANNKANFRKFIGFLSHAREKKSDEVVRHLREGKN